VCVVLLRMCAELIDEESVVSAFKVLNRKASVLCRMKKLLGGFAIVFILAYCTFVGTYHMFFNSTSKKRYGNDVRVVGFAGPR